MQNYKIYSQKSPVIEPDNQIKIIEITTLVELEGLCMSIEGQLSQKLKNHHFVVWSLRRWTPQIYIIAFLCSFNTLPPGLHPPAKSRIGRIKK